jgi:hypothetical protein
MSGITQSLPEKELDKLPTVLASIKNVTHEAGVSGAASFIHQDIDTLGPDLASIQRIADSAGQTNMALSIDFLRYWEEAANALYISIDWKRMSEQGSSTEVFRPTGRIGDLLDQKIDAIRDQYSFYNNVETEGFLRNNSDLVPILFEAIYPIRKYFGATQLKLRYSEDPEGTGDNYLDLAITTDEPVDTALEKLEAFDRHWWLEAGKDESRLIIDIEIE